MENTRKWTDEKMEQVLHALEHPSDFSDEELQALLADEECVAICRALLAGKEGLARRYAPVPDVGKEWEQFARKHGSRPRRYLLPWVAGIASVACIALLLWWQHLAAVPQPDEGCQVFEASAVEQAFSMKTESERCIVTVPRGMRKQIALPDGTTVWLNADSRLAYPASLYSADGQRKVELEGEACFDVAKDTLHPFIVEMGTLEACVRGTTFNVRAYASGQTQVTLLSGSLGLKETSRSDEQLIRPGDKAVVGHDGSLSVEHTRQAGDYASWREGTFYFDNMELVEIMCELGRWYNVSVRFKHPHDMHHRLHFKADRQESLQQIVGLLNEVGKVKTRVEGSTVYVGE